MVESSGTDDQTARLTNLLEELHERAAVAGSAKGFFGEL
jgi:hypothetical protein